MEFHQKLQELRKQRGLTQEELAGFLFVSRTAISKWESGRGYPGIDSIKDISKFFSVSIDDLLSSEEIINIADEDTKKKERHFLDLVFGLIDVSAAILMFLPFFAQRTSDIITEVSLLELTDISPHTAVLYYIAVVGTVLVGITNLALQRCNSVIYLKIKYKLSLLFNLFGVFIFAISPQPYAAVMMLVFLVIKSLLVIKKL
jgi:transcriptional regulator with XRE-family HTH domain